MSDIPRVLVYYPELDLNLGAAKFEVQPVRSPLDIPLNTALSAEPAQEYAGSILLSCRRMNETDIENLKSLTPNQYTILQFLATGFTVKTIAQKLESTVVGIKSYSYKICRKLGTVNKAAATTYIPIDKRLVDASEPIYDERLGRLVPQILTPRQRDLFVKLGSGMIYGQIADSHGVQHSTITTQAHHITELLELDDTKANSVYLQRLAGCLATLTATVST